uniref:Uncharacterized protein n=1 Tax=Anguilla anguilla TaxID=7936 RepID=A0A0E9T665_ANGAN
MSQTLPQTQSFLLLHTFCFLFLHCIRGVILQYDICILQE